MNASPPSKREAMANRIYRGLCGYAQEDALAVVAACDFTLDRLQDKLPAPEIGAAAPFWTSARQEAALWASVASDRQVLGMLVACLDQINGTRAAQRDREALLVALFNSLPPDRRKAFIRSVSGPNTPQEARR